MRADSHIWITKKIASNQKDKLKGLNYSEQALIETQSLDFEWSNCNSFGKVIFTSTQAVYALFLKNKSLKPVFESIYVVGNKTAEVLNQFGFKSKFVAKNANELAWYIVDNEPKTSFTYFCGNKRRDTLPTLLNEQGFSLDEICVYKTILNPQRLEIPYTDVFFFSPTAVKSYIKADNILSVPVYCLGPSTACEALKYFDQVYVAENPNIEDLISLYKTSKSDRDE